MAESVMNERVLVAMSGGVDSSVAAAMLVEQGYDVVGATMKLFCHDGDLPDRPCCSLDSVNDARRVCQSLGVPHYVLNLESAFGRDVVDNFVNEYAAGRTPIPCVRCNTFTKFRDLVRRPTRSTRAGSRRGTTRASSTASSIAASTTPRISRTSSGESTAPCCRACSCPSARRPRPRRAPWRTGWASRSSPRRRRARTSASCPTATTRRSFADDSAPTRRRSRAGPIVLSDGTAVGTHDGFARFTIGQRRGLPGGFREPMFVVAIRPADRAVVIGPRAELLGRGVVARSVNWLGRRAGGGRAGHASGAPPRRARARGDRAPRRRRDRARARRRRVGDHPRPVARALRRRAGARRRVDRTRLACGIEGRRGVV